MLNNYFEIKGDIFSTNFKNKFDTICHQCNCVTDKGAGFYKVLVDKYPEVEIYSQRKILTQSDDSGNTIPGTIRIMKSSDYRTIIHMFSQYYPGKPKYWDNCDKRTRWFSECLDKIKNTPNIKSIAFPYKIGCGLAGGDWFIYKKIIQNFAKNNQHISVYVVNNNIK